MAIASLFRRGRTWFVRLNIPQERWSEVGRAMGAKGGIKREIVRTLGTTDYREAPQRRDVALSEIRAEIDGALVTAKLRALTDWTADWKAGAVAHREYLRANGADVIQRR